MSTEQVPCPLCATTARRSELRLGNGYLYDCIMCGGFYEVGAIAQRRIDDGKGAGHVAQDVRRLFAAGRRPRVMWNAEDSRFIAEPV